MKRLLTVVAVVLTVMSTTASVNVRTLANPEPQFVLCYSASINPSLHQWFYSSIFRGDRANGKKFADAFWHYLLDTYPDRNMGPAGCRFYNSDSDAKTDKRTLQGASKADSIETGWTYGN